MPTDPRIQSLERMLADGLLTVDQYIQGLAAIKPAEPSSAAAPVAPSKNAKKNAKKRLKKKTAAQPVPPPALAEEDSSSVHELAVGTLVHVTANEEAKTVDEKRRATDPFWTAKPSPIVRIKERAGQPTLYYIEGQGKHGWTASQLRA